ncbi:GAF domain-containing protein [Klenkia soli]|uniref:GAF domain-containing protein n=1 Tax=Klenkia soli TaxID=1052260 RepID=A0A1H0P651_9ACTN|nr:GAF and ANTAR domain-containing protein [Klenkia soli]SDP00512.1 GAF domain-containing protein [Klenkia soli]
MTDDRPGGRLVVADVLASVVSQGDRSIWADALVVDCQRHLGAAGVGLAVADDSGPVGVLAASRGAGQVGEDLQFALGEGPCRLAARDRRTVHAPDLARDDRWVQFGRSAAEAGIAAATSVPLQVGAVLVGVLDVYCGTPGPLAVESARDLVVYGQAATAVLLLLADVDEVGGAGGNADVLADLADIRPVVHQAAGMVAVQLGMDLGEALLELRARAFGAGRSLRDLATDVVARRTRFDVPPHGRPTGDTPSADPERNPDEHP